MASAPEANKSSFRAKHLEICIPTFFRAVLLAREGVCSFYLTLSWKPDRLRRLPVGTGKCCWTLRQDGKPHPIRDGTGNTPLCKLPARDPLWAMEKPLKGVCRNAWVSQDVSVHQRWCWDGLCVAAEVMPVQLCCCCKWQAARADTGKHSLHLTRTGWCRRQQLTQRDWRKQENGQKLSYHLGFISPEMLLEKCKALVAEVSLEDSQNSHQQVRLSWILVKSPFLKSDVWSQQVDVPTCLCVQG